LVSFPIDFSGASGLFDIQGQLLDPAAISTCGYSPIAIKITMLAGCCLVVFVVMLGLRYYKAGIPLAGSCSIAISAACHGSSVDMTAPLK
jgi:hypothetical protein